WPPLRQCARRRPRDKARIASQAMPVRDQVMEAMHRIGPLASVGHSMALAWPKRVGRCCQIIRRTYDRAPAALLFQCAMWALIGASVLFRASDIGGQFDHLLARTTGRCGARIPNRPLTLPSTNGLRMTGVRGHALQAVGVLPTAWSV